MTGSLGAWACWKAKKTRQAGTASDRSLRGVPQVKISSFKNVAVINYTEYSLEVK